VVRPCVVKSCMWAPGQASAPKLGPSFDLGEVDCFSTSQTLETALARVVVGPLAAMQQIKAGAASKVRS
jgi:hypothetical protein